MKLNTCSLSKADGYKIYGFKASNLCKCMNNGLSVPNGKVINIRDIEQLFSLKSEFPNSSLLKLTDFDHAFLNWLKNQENLLSVRSSAIVPSNNAGLVSGLFKSIRKIRPCLRNTVDAIEKIIYDSQSHHNHFIDMGIPVYKCTTIIQEEIYGLLSGIGHTTSLSMNKTTDIWFVEGDLQPLVSGEIFGNQVRFPKNQSTKLSEIWCSEKTLQYADSLGFWDICHSLINSFEQIENIFGAPMLIEWIFNGEKFYILQVQHLNLNL